MIPLEAQEALRLALTERLRGRVKIDLFTQQQSSLVVPGREPCVVCPDTEELVADLARLSPLITLTVHQLGADRALQAKLGVQRVPALVFRGITNRPLLFYGLPLPPLFSAMIDLAQLVSIDKVYLPVRVQGRLRRLRDDVNLQVLVTTESDFCREMLQLVYTFGTASKFVHVEAIELASFPTLAQRLAPSHVPFTTINGRASFPGLVTPETLMDLIVHTVSHPTVLVERPETLGMTAVAPPESQNQQRSGYEPVLRPSGLYVP